MQDWKSRQGAYLKSAEVPRAIRVSCVYSIHQNVPQFVENQKTCGHGWEDPGFLKG